VVGWSVRLAVVAALLGPALVARPQGASACSCAPIVPAEWLAEFAAAFIGTPTAVDEDPAEVWPEIGGTVARQYTFEVQRAWKSPGGTVVDLQTPRDGPACGAQLQLGVAYVVFGWGDPARLTFSSCGAIPAADAQELIGALDASATPGAPAVGSAGLAAEGDKGGRGGVALAVALAAAAGAALLARGARRRVVE
jgi:hypothetical protein